MTEEGNKDEKKDDEKNDKYEIFFKKITNFTPF